MSARTMCSGVPDFRLLFSTLGRSYTSVNCLFGLSLKEAYLAGISGIPSLVSSVLSKWSSTIVEDILGLCYVQWSRGCSTLRCVGETPFDWNRALILQMAKKSLIVGSFA